MNSNTINPCDHVYAVIDTNDDDFAWMGAAIKNQTDNFIVVEADVAHIGECHSANELDTPIILDGCHWGVFEANAGSVFHTELEAAKVARERNRANAFKLMEETSTVAGMLNFLIEHDALKVPSSPIAREILYAQMEDAGLGHLVPLYAIV